MEISRGKVSFEVSYLTDYLDLKHYLILLTALSKEIVTASTIAVTIKFCL